MNDKLQMLEHIYTVIDEKAVLTGTERRKVNAYIQDLKTHLEGGSEGYIELMPERVPLIGRDILLSHENAAVNGVYSESRQIEANHDERIGVTTFKRQDDDVIVQTVMEHHRWVDVDGQHLLDGKRSTYEYYGSNNKPVGKRIVTAKYKGQQAIDEENRLKALVITELYQMVERDLGKDGRKAFARILAAEITQYPVNREGLQGGINALNDENIPGVEEKREDYVKLINIPY